MSKDIIPTTGRSINTVTAEIKAISNQAAQMAYLSMVEIGRRLVEAKELVPHGEWSSYLKHEVNFSHRTANNFMQIYDRSLTPGNSQTFANLGYSHIVKLLALPDEDLEEFTESHDVAAMSVRQLDQAIKERDEERRAKDEAEAARRDAEQQVQDLQTKLAAAQSKEGTWNDEIEKLQAALDKTSADLAAAQVPKPITDEQKETLLSEVKADFQGQLDAATAAIADAERRAAIAEATLKDSKKTEALANPDAMAFRLLGQQIVDNCNRMAGYRMKVGASDPDLDAKMKTYMLSISELFRKKAEATSQEESK